MPKNSYAKARALRIPLLRSHSRDRLAKLRNVLTLAAVVICVGWLVAGYFFGRDSGLDRYSPGPVSRAHAQLGCQDCHNDSAPLRDATFLSAWKHEHDTGEELWHRESDMLCRQCHPVPGASQSLQDIFTSYSNEKIGQPIPVLPHAVNQQTSSVDSCASCHLEHRGADVLPSQVADASCVSCHQRLEDFRESPDNSVTSIKNVTRFNGGHPDFRSLQQDRGVIKFSHQLHMAPGIADEGSQEILKVTPSHYSDPNEQLRGFASNGLIQLECRFCHVPTDKPTIGTDLGSSMGGKFMSMPSYEQNCKVCHPLELEARATDALENAPRPPLAFQEKLRIEHGVNSEKILNDLKFYFSLEALAATEHGKQLNKEDFNTPGKLQTRLLDFANTKPEFADAIQSRVVEVATRVRIECRRCHFAAQDNTMQRILAVRSMTEDPQLANQTAGMFDATLLKHGRFDHSAHRDVACARCHESSVGKGQLTNVADDRLMINDLQSCLECHQDPANVTLPDRPGPTSCISCHTYHGGGNRQ